MTAWPWLSCLKAYRGANLQLAVSQGSWIARPVLRCLATLHPCHHASLTIRPQVGRLLGRELSPSFSLQASSPRHSGGGVGKERGACKLLHLSNLNSTSNSLVAPHQLSGQISTNQREAEKNANVNKHSKTQAKGK